MKNSLSVLLFAVVVVVQLSVPTLMIAGREYTLREGAVYRFKTAPVDSYDPSWGRFVELQLMPNTAPLPAGERIERNQEVFAVLGEDEEGFAEVTRLTLFRPEGGDYVPVKAYHSGSGDVRLRWPIDQYYLDEKLAPEAERLYRQRGRGEPRSVYVTVRVRNGKAVLEELYIDGVPIVEFVMNELAD